MPAGNDSAATRSYGGWQQEKVAFLFGLSGRRAAMVGAAVLAAIVPVATVRIAAAALYWPAAVFLAAAAYVRVGGRTTDEWLIAAVSWGITAFRHQNKFAAGPFTPPDSGDQTGKPVQPDLPGILASLRILTVPAGHDTELAIVHHGHDRSYTAIACLRFPGIGLTDSERRDQRVAGWGALLAGLCTEGNPIVRIQAMQRIVPESGAALRRWHTDHLAADAPQSAREITALLLASSTVATARRESYLAFTLDAHRAHAQIRAAGGGELGAVTILLRHLKTLAGAAGAAELEITDWLGPRDLAEVIRTAFDPASQPLLDTQRAATSAALQSEEGGVAAGVTPALAGPMYAEARPGVYLHDGAASVTYWVQTWPQSASYCTALAPLLAETGYRRTLSVLYEPMGPRAAERAIMRERTARSVAIRMRQRTGQIVPEHEQAAAAKARLQDVERAAGHGLVRFTAYLTATADIETIEDACSALEADAAAARIEVRRMWFAQDVGFAAAALPLGLGMPRRRW